MHLSTLAWVLRWPGNLGSQMVHTGGGGFGLDEVDIRYLGIYGKALF